MSVEEGPFMVSLMSCPAADGPSGEHGFPGGGEMCVCGRQGVWRTVDVPTDSAVAEALRGAGAPLAASLVRRPVNRR